MGNTFRGPRGSYWNQVAEERQHSLPVLRHRHCQQMLVCFAIVQGIDVQGIVIEADHKLDIAEVRPGVRWRRRDGCHCSWLETNK